MLLVLVVSYFNMYVEFMRSDFFFRATSCTWHLVSRTIYGVYVESISLITLILSLVYREWRTFHNNYNKHLEIVCSTLFIVDPQYLFYDH